MSKRLHTPGPWKAVENGFYMQGVKSASGAWLTYKAGQDDMGQKMIEANARLIAAAPDLLEALEIYAAAYNEHWKPGMPILEPISDAAIAKARGAS